MSSLDSTAPKYDCDVCGNEFPDTAGVLACEEHFYCNDCAIEVFHRSMTDMTEFPASCCSRSRNGLPPALFKDLLGEEFMEKYFLKLSEYYTAEAIRVYCANAQCAKYHHPRTFDKSDHRRTVVPCECGTTPCVSCKAEWQPEHACIQSDLSKRPSWLPEYSAECRIKQCPNCLEWIQLSDACNHMTCISCAHCFCFVCLIPWTAFHEAQGCPVYGDPAAGYDDEGFERTPRGIHLLTGRDRDGHAREITTATKRAAEIYESLFGAPYPYAVSEASEDGNEDLEDLLGGDLDALEDLNYRMYLDTLRYDEDQDWADVPDEWLQERNERLADRNENGPYNLNPYRGLNVGGNPPLPPQQIEYDPDIFVMQQEGIPMLSEEMMDALNPPSDNEEEGDIYPLLMNFQGHGGEPPQLINYDPDMFAMQDVPPPTEQMMSTLYVEEIAAHDMRPLEPPAFVMQHGGFEEGVEEPGELARFQRLLAIDYPAPINVAQYPASSEEIVLEDGNAGEDDTLDFGLEMMFDDEQSLHDARHPTIEVAGSATSGMLQCSIEVHENPYTVLAEPTEERDDKVKGANSRQ